MSAIVVRTCVAEDAELAARVLGDVVDGRAALPRLADLLGRREVVLCVATVDGVSAGIAYGYVYPRLKDSHDATLLYEVDVAEGFRQRGVGAALMREFGRACKFRGAPKHWLISDHGNEAAMRLYESVGGVLSKGNEAMFSFGDDEPETA